MRMMLVAFMCGTVASCGGHANVQCEQDADCDLSGGGRCLAASTGNQWCAYPDPDCPGGYRYSDDDVGDGLGDTCAAAQTFTLTVKIGGDAAGTVTSNPDGLQCAGATCTGVFAAGSQVQLTASPTASAFLGWSGDCVGFGACSVTLDHDRSVGARFGLNGEGLWVVQIGGTGYERAYSIATTTDGNLIAVGQFEGAVQVGQQTITSHGGTDIYVAKIDSTNGDVIWAKALGGTSGETAASVVLDDSDDIYVAGTFAGSVDFGGGNVLTAAGNTDALFLKLTADGDVVWAHGIGGADYDYGDAVAVRGDTLVVSAQYRGSITVSGTNYASHGYYDVFLAEYSLAGASNWAKSVGGTGIDLGLGLAVDGDGNVVLAGRFGNTADFGGGSIDAGSSGKGYIAKYDGGTGAFLYAKPLGSAAVAGTSQVNAATVDASKNIIVVGPFSGSIDFGDGSAITSSNPYGDMYAAKYSPAGALIWVKTFSTSANDQAPIPTSVSANAVGDVAFTGNFCGTVSLGGPMLVSASACPNNDVFAARLAAADGAHVNSVRAGGQGDEFGQGVTQTMDGRFFVSGRFQGFADFAGQALTSAGNDDAFLLGLAPL